jgi:hypothetical protein
MTLATLAPEWRIGDLSLTTAPFLVPFGTDYGAPDASPEVLTSFLTDGDLELTPRSGNRTLTLPVLIEATDLSALAAAEKALQLECDKTLNTLYVDPGDGAGEPFQFTVMRAQATFVRDDDYERAGYHLWSVTWRALPWPEAASEVTVAALPASGSTTTSVDTMSSVTGWTAAVDGTSVTPTTAGGQITVSKTSLTNGTHTFTATRTGSIATSSTKYLALDWKAGAGTVATGITAVGDGVNLPVIASQASPTAGYTRTWFQAAASSVAAVTFSVTTKITTAFDVGITNSVVLDDLNRTDVRPSLGSAKQQLRSLTVKGSAPTRGSLSVQHASTSLGDVLIYTCPDDGSGYVPAMRNYHTSGSVTSDSTAVSGAYDALDGSHTTVGYTVPYSAAPEGDYLVMARMLSTSTSDAVNLSWQFKTAVSGTVIGTVPVASTLLPVTTGYELYRVGSMVHLPPFDATASPNSSVTLTVTWVSGVGVRLDEVFLFNLSTGRLSQFSCGTGTAASGGPANRLWVDSPSVDNDGMGRYMMGFAADRSDAYTALVAATHPGVHEFEPPGMKVFTVATNPTTAVDVAYRYRPTGHSSVYAG